MQPRLWIFIGAFLTTNALHAGDSLLATRRAQALLGGDVWSEVIRIENNFRVSRYGRVVYALVFEVAGRLWFYTDTEGTQSFSLRRGRLDEDKADFGPLLRDIEPGFTHWTVMPAAAVTAGPVFNACFIESVAAWRARLARGDETARAQLLAYYVETPSGTVGHTVLTFEAGGELEVIDPESAPGPAAFPGALAGNPLALARAIRHGDVARARLLPLEAPASLLVAGQAGTAETAELRHGVVSVRQ